MVATTHACQYLSLATYTTRSYKGKFTIMNKGTTNIKISICIELVQSDGES